MRKQTPQRERLIEVVDSITEDMIYERINADFYESKLPWKSAKEDKQAFDAYNEDRARLQELFKKQAFEALGITNTNLQDIIWRNAWEHGHSEGFSGIFNWMRDYVEFTNEISKELEKK